MRAWMGELKSRFLEEMRQLLSFSKNPEIQWSQLSKPDDEWQVLKEMALWTIPSAIARLLGWGYWHFWASVFKSILWYILWLVFMWGLAKLIRIMGVVFNSNIDESRCMQLSFYGFLPLLISSILYINPLLGLLTPIIALYGLWIIYYGLHQLPDLPKTQKLIFFGGVATVMVIGALIIGSLTGGLFLPKY